MLAIIFNQILQCYENRLVARGKKKKKEAFSVHARLLE
jgi:hypothetical protein